MELSEAIEMMGYDPRFSWVSNGPLVYFNKHTLAAGEQFKVLVRYPQWWYGSPYLSISTAGPNGEQIVTKELTHATFRDHSRVIPANSSYYGTVVNTTDELQIGAYVAHVRIPELGRVGAEHSFEVYEPDFYTARLQEMMGDAWDDPVYLDDLERGEAEGLLLSLPTDEFLSFLPEGLVLDNRTICQLLGPLATTFMQGAMGPLPFSVDYRVAVDETRLPHIDLVKSIWLLNAIAPAWADMMFFSGACIVGSSVEDRSIYLGIESYLPDLFYQRFKTQEEEAEKLPPLVTTVTSNIRHQLDCEIRWASPFRAWIEIRE
jgi:hypothetical protein